MNSKFHLIDATGGKLNVIDYSGEVDVLRAKAIAHQQISRKKIYWESNAPHMVQEPLKIVEG